MHRRKQFRSQALKSWLTVLVVLAMEASRVTAQSGSRGGDIARNCANRRMRGTGDAFATGGG